MVRTPKRYIYLQLTYKNKHQLFTSAQQALDMINSLEKGTTEDNVKVHLEEDCHELQLKKGELYLLGDLLPKLPYNTKIVLHYGFYNDRRKKIKLFRKGNLTKLWRFC
jgi:hypothetical protein